MSALLPFLVLAGLLIVTSLAVIIAKNPVTSAFFLVADLFFVACLYAIIGAHFAAAIQVLVYAGAIMVLFLFVIMLLNLHVDELKGPRIGAPEVGVIVALLAAVTCLGIYLLVGGGFEDPLGLATRAGHEILSNTYAVGMQLFTKYIWPFELASFLILLAIIASVVIAKKDKPKTTSK